MEQYKIRAHHGMCLAFFRGRGYSSAFTEHMAGMKQILKDDVSVCIVNETDDICGPCPNNRSGICRSQEKVTDYDGQVLTVCGLQPGTVMEWQQFEELVRVRILDAGRRSGICGECQWNEICAEEEKCNTNYK